MNESSDRLDPLVEARYVSKAFPARPGLHGVSRRRWVHAVDRVSLALGCGEIVGLIGESGSGKSTLGRLLIRLENPTAGRIFFESSDITQYRGRKLRRARRRMQIIFQDPSSSLNPRYTVRDTLVEAIRVHRRTIKKRELFVRLAALLQMVGLPASELDRFPREFSGGERQRIAIARALAVDPQFIVADEPISSLDLSNQAQILRLIEDLRRELNVSFLLISHDLDVIQYLSARVAVMYLGRIVELAPTEQLFAAARHPYTRALIAATLSPDPDANHAPAVLPGDPPSPQDPPAGCAFHPRCFHTQSRCRLIEPKLREPSPGHFTKCHFDFDWTD